MRLRLTILYGGLFVCCGAALLAITYLLVRHFAVVSTHTYGPLQQVRSGSRQVSPLPRLPSLRQLQVQAQHDLASQHASDLHQLLVWSGVALAAMACVSIALGWLVAGRVLRPLRTITATTRRISQHNLDERLALAGPRDELSELADTIDGLLARLERAFEAQKRFVANASHELRTPLAMMRTSLDVAAAKPGPLPPQLQSLDAKLREGLDQADRLLEDFLVLARADHALPETAEISLPAIVSAEIEARSDTIAAKAITAEQTLGAARVRGSETLLARMVGNLLDNAVRHNQPQGWVRIETQTRGGTVHLRVENGGVPLDQSSVAELAQPFRRLAAERTASANGGHGLGLSIVAAIVAAHGGTLQLHARPEGGLDVQVELAAVSREPG